MSQLISRYQNNALASKKKHIYTRLLDYFSMFVISYLLYTLFLPLSARFPFAKDISRNISHATRALYDYVDSTKLQTYTEDKKALEEINVGAANYVKRLTMTSCYVHDIGFPVKQEDHTYIDLPVSKEDTFINDLVNYEYDNNSYFYRVFKANEPSLNSYNGKTYDQLSESEIEQYIFTDRMKLVDSNFVTVEDEDYIARAESAPIYDVLTLENTLTLKKYFGGDNKEKALYNKLYKCYANGIQAGIKDVEKHCKPYKSLLKTFDYWNQRVAMVYIVAYTISYSIAYLLMIFIPRLFFKEWQSLGQHVLNVGISDVNECEPSFWRYLIYYVVNFLLFYTTLFIALLIINQITALNLYVVTHITFLSVLLFIGIFNIISLFMPLFTKKNHDASTFASGLLLKDKGEFDTPIEDVVSDVNKEENEENALSE